MSALCSEATLVSATDYATRFLELLFGRCNAGVIAVSAIPAPRPENGRIPTEYFPVDDVASAAAWGVERSDSADVYVRVTTLERPLQPWQRGGAADTLDVPALWLDVDVQGDGHKGNGYPPSIELAAQLLNAIGLPPTLLVRSGGGLQPYWLLEEPEPRDAAEPLVRRWQAAWHQRFAVAGYKLDNVSDLARILRLPGTYNRKPTFEAPPPVTFEDPGARYRLDELVTALAALEAAYPPSAPLTTVAAPATDRALNPDDPYDALTLAVPASVHFVARAAEQRGWRIARQRPEYVDLIRPDGDAGPASSGLSARVGRAPGGAEHLIGYVEVFTDSAAVAQGSYSLGNFLAQVAFDGDHQATKRWLAAQGYGIGDNDAQRAAYLEQVYQSDAPAPLDAGGDVADPAPLLPPPKPPRPALRERLLSTDGIRSLPPPDWLVNDVLPTNALAMLYGQPGSMKSFAAIELSLDIASGRPAWTKATKQGPVLYIVAEGADGIGQRIDAWEDFYATDAPHVDWLPEPLNLYDVGAAKELLEATQDIGARLVVVDTVARCTVGVQENDARDVGIVVDHVDAIRATTGATVLLVHHSGKDTARGARGSNAYEGAVTTHIEMKKASETTRRLVVHKQKNAAATSMRLDVAAVGSSLVLVPVDNGTPTERTLERCREAYEALRAIGPAGATKTEWLLAAGIKERTFHRHAQELDKAGFVRPAPHDHRKWVVAAVEPLLAA